MYVRLRCIGYVVKGMPEDEGVRWDRWSEESLIELHPKYSKATLGLEEYSHIYVIYWMDRVRLKERGTLVYRPRYSPSAPEVGAFATRSRARPNPIGLTVCELLEVRGGSLKVRGLDAYTGSPVLDLKPYDYFDVVKSPRVPSWFLDAWSARQGSRPAWLGA